jgi:hypothetical protein
LALTPGTRLGVYDIAAQIGVGGMGEVYQATDTNLKRQVAVKVLPASVAGDADRLARFQREAEVLAALNHPNIAAIYGLEKTAGFTALVMELVEGDDLSQRIGRGAIPIDEALPIAKQIADALEAAHEQGIIHRDLKPANIKVRSDGTVKVLDFGLAKAMDPVGSAPNVSQSPTITTPAMMTGVGVILGTAAYMSPEQVAGKPVDRRADIWSFGVVLWEILSGRRLFDGDTVAHTLADVLRRSIDFDTLMAPAPIKNLLRRCLDRDVKTRLRDIGEARVTIGKYLADPANGEVPPEPRRAREWVAWAAAAVLAVLAIVGWLRARPEGSSPTADLAFTIAPAAGGLAPVGDIQATPEISPDGTAVMFYGDGVHLRRLNRLIAERVRTGAFTSTADTGFSGEGFWSPDSRSFVFTDGTNLKKMRVPDGALETVTMGVAALIGGSWSHNGTLLVSTPSGPFAVSAAGGVAKPIDVTGLSFERGFGFFWPEFLPGSEDFLVLSESITGGIDQSEIYLATLRDGRAVDPVLLMQNATAARYTPAGGGRLLFVRNDNLYAQTLNRAARKLEGEPELVQQRVASSPAFHVAHFSVSSTGVVAWRPGTAGLSQVTIFDRQGREIGTAGSPTVVQTLRLAPNETHLLLGFNATAWLLEPGRPGQQRLPQGSYDTLWSPDGSTFLDSIPPGGKDIRVVERPVNGEGAVRELAKPPGMGQLEDISSDGKTLLLSRGPVDNDVFSVGLDNVQKDPKPLVQTGEIIAHARFSPDGRWIVYTASAGGVGSGREGLWSGGGTYVQPYPGPGLRKQLTSHGNYPVWRKDGREIVYLDEFQGRTYIWSVPVTAAGAEFRAGTPSPLFPARLPATTFPDLNFLAVSRDGSRFYIPQAVAQPESDVIHVRMGWAK